MEDVSYTVAFAGECQPGTSEAEVRARLAKVLKLDDRRAAQLFSGRTVVIKRNIDESGARRFKAAFERCGAVCLVTPVPQERRSRPRDEPPAPPEALNLPRVDDVQDAASTGTTPETPRPPRKADGTGVDVQSTRLQEPQPKEPQPKEPQPKEPQPKEPQPKAPQRKAPQPKDSQQQQPQLKKPQPKKPQQKQPQQVKPGHGKPQPGKPQQKETSQRESGKQESGQQEPGYQDQHQASPAQKQLPSGDARRRRRFIVPAAIAILLVAAGGGYLWWLSQSSDDGLPPVESAPPPEDPVAAAPQPVQDTPPPEPVSDITAELAQTHPPAGSLDAARNATVHVESDLGTGTGLFLSDSCILTTSRQLAASGDRRPQVTVRLINGRKIDAFTLALSREQDLAYLALKEEQCPVVPMERVEQVDAGLEVTLIQSAGPDEPAHRIVSGVTTGMTGTDADQRLIQTDILPEASGRHGVLIGTDGQLLGFYSAAGAIPAGVLLSDYEDRSGEIRIVLRAKPFRTWEPEETDETAAEADASRDPVDSMEETDPRGAADSQDDTMSGS